MTHLVHKLSPTKPLRPVSPLDDNAHILIPDWAELPPFYATEDVPLAQKQIVLKLFTPDSSWTWLIAEYDPAERLAFGYAYNAADSIGAEWGYIYIPELEAVRGPNGLPVERDIWFNAKPFAATEVANGGVEMRLPETVMPETAVHQPQDVDLEHHAIYLADGLRVYTPICVIDTECKTLVCLEIIGPKQSVKANWAALMNHTGDATIYLYGHAVLKTGMKQHVLLKRKLPCGWEDWLLLHKQASLQTVKPGRPFYLLSAETDTLPDLFYPLLNHCLKLPILPAWTASLWRWGQTHKLITLAEPRGIGFNAWRVATAEAAWEQLVQTGLQQDDLQI